MQQDGSNTAALQHGPKLRNKLQDMFLAFR
jgi:hypothetical protein